MSEGTFSHVTADLCDVDLHFIVMHFYRKLMHSILQLGRVIIYFNPFIPELPKWTIPSLNWDTPNVARRGLSLKSKTEWQFRS